MTFTCAVCGAAFERKPYDAARFTAVYCSRRCFGESQRAMASALSGENAYRWKGDAAKPASGRRRAITLYPPRPCEQCGVMPPGRGSQRHHIDRNTLNNAPENIQFLCASCHKKLHAALITHCKHGHAYDEANTRIKQKPRGRTQRVCRACTASADAARRVARKAVAS